MKHELLVIGKVKDRFIAEGLEEYCKRLSHYSSFNIKTLNPKGKGKGKFAGKEHEGTILLNAVPPQSLKIVLDAAGRQMTSEELAEQIQSWEVRGVKKVCYLIGGPEGHSREVLDTADVCLSLSKMTFTHDMVRLFLVEQLYRAYTILAGEKYHK